MSEFVENIIERMQADSKAFAKIRDIERVYIAELACGWIENNVKTKEEFAVKVKAMGEILTCPDFAAAIEASKLAYKERDREKAEEAAEAIRRIRATEEYKRNSRLANYKLLDKYDDPNTFKTNSFATHTNIMLRLYDYLKGYAEEVKE